MARFLEPNCPYAWGDCLAIAYLGDSHTVLCTWDSKDHLILVQLTTEHPNFSSLGYGCMHLNTYLDCTLHSCTLAIGELARILNTKGRVFAMDDEPEISLTFTLFLN